MEVKCMKYNAAAGKWEDAPRNDYNGAITGQCVAGLGAWMLEHPTERAALGYSLCFIGDKPEYNHQTHYLRPIYTERIVNGETVYDVTYAIETKTEDMIAAQIAFEYAELM